MYYLNKIFLSLSFQENIKEIDPGSDIWDYKQNYIPKVFNPLPEYLIYADLAVLFILMSIGLFITIKRKSSKVLSAVSLFALVYLGIIRGGCICPIGAVSNVTYGLINPHSIGFVTLLIFILPIIFALVAGRVFCSSGCAIGALQDILYKKDRFYRLPNIVNNIIKFVPIVLLFATIYCAIESICYLACKIEPYKALFFTTQSWFEQCLAFVNGSPMESKILFAFGIYTWLYLIIILIVGYWIPRPFCKLLCPYGVILGVFALFSFKKRRICDSLCVLCGACEKNCPTQAIKIDRENKKVTLSNYDCIQCNRCSDKCKKNAIL